MSKVSTRPPAVERIAGWSARHRKTAVVGWLVLIVAAVFAGSLLGNHSPLNSNDPGEAGRAEVALNKSGVQQDSESVLIQSRSGATLAGSADFRQSVADVAAALRTL